MDAGARDFEASDRATYALRNVDVHRKAQPQPGTERDAWFPRGVAQSLDEVAGTRYVRAVRIRTIVACQNIERRHDVADRTRDLSDNAIAEYRLFEPIGMGN